MARRLKILLSAYACEPDKGSEPEVGWQWAIRLAEFHHVTVVTRANNAPAIQAALDRVTTPHPRFIFSDLSPFWIALKKRGFPVQVYYLLWQLMIRWRFRKSLREFDLIHHLTFNSFLLPGFWWLGSHPFVLGPLGGGQICPSNFLTIFGSNRIMEWSRSLIVNASVWNPIHRLNCRRAKLIMAANQDTAARIPNRYSHKIRLGLETAIAADAGSSATQPAEINLQPSPEDKGVVRFLWVGRLEKRKALPLALQALKAALKKENLIRLTVVGTGPDEEELRSLAEQLALVNQVEWLGRRSRTEVDRLMSCSDVFLFTSVRDTSGNVLLEAMLAGLPVITLNHQGAAEMTTDETAIRIPPTTIPETVAALAEACVALAQDRERRRQMGRAGRAHVLRHHTWERRVATMNQIYAELATELARAK